MFLATSDWSVFSRHLTSDEYNEFIDYYGCSWPEGLGMSCTVEGYNWFYSGDNFFLDGYEWVGYNGGFDGHVHDFSSGLGWLSIGVRPVITISKSKLS
jgi:hypothetical protein